MSESIGQLFLVIGILLLIFLLIRQLNLWYWKINTLISLLSEMRALLRYNLPEQVAIEISEHYSKENPFSPIWTRESDEKKMKPTAHVSDKQWICRCGNINPIIDTTCKHCGRVPNAVI